MKSNHADARCATNISLHPSDITLITTSTVLAVARDFTGKEKKMTRLIDVDELKKSTCDKGVCSDCEDFHKGNNVATNCSEVRWYFLEKINEQPTVDAIPVEWLYDLADKKESETDIKLSLMIKGVVALWHREKQNDSD